MINTKTVSRTSAQSLVSLRFSLSLFLSLQLAHAQKEREKNTHIKQGAAIAEVPLCFVCVKPRLKYYVTVIRGVGCPRPI